MAVAALGFASVSLLFSVCLIAYIFAIRHGERIINKALSKQVPLNNTVPPIMKVATPRLSKKTIEKLSEAPVEEKIVEKIPDAPAVAPVVAKSEPVVVAVTPEKELPRVVVPEEDELSPAPVKEPAFRFKIYNMKDVKVEPFIVAGDSKEEVRELAKDGVQSRSWGTVCGVDWRSERIND